MQLTIEPIDGVVLSKKRPADPWTVSVMGQSMTVRGGKFKALEIGKDLLEVFGEQVPDPPPTDR